MVSTSFIKIKDGCWTSLLACGSQEMFDDWAIPACRQAEEFI
jgi:hypothetical protein